MSDTKTAKNVSLDNIRNFCTFFKSDSHKRYYKKRNAKVITVAMSKKLCGLNNDRLNGYKRAHECANYLFQDGSKVTAYYCKHRCCNVCNRIKAAKMLNVYTKPLLEIKDMHFVTLTAPNVPGGLLRYEIVRMNNVWRQQIYRSIKRYHKHLNLRGMRKLEITYNYKKRDFNPHFHFLVDGQELSELIRKLWLKYNPKASIDGQDIRKANSKSLYELFKYVTKSVVDKNYSAVAMDTIYAALKDKNTYYPFGLNKYVSEEIEELQSQVIDFKNERVDVWKWCNDLSDWYTTENEPFINRPMENKTKGIIKIIDDSGIDDMIDTDFLMGTIRKKIRDKLKPIEF